MLIKQIVQDRNLNSFKNIQLIRIIFIYIYLNKVL